MPNFTGICGKIVLFIAGFIVASTSTFGAGSLCLWHNEVAATLWPLQLRRAQLNCALSCAVDTEFVFAIFGEIIAEIDFAILQYFAEFFT